MSQTATTNQKRLSAREKEAQPSVLQQAIDNTRARPVLPQNYEQWWRLAEAAFKSRFKPKDFNCVEDIFLAMQYGVSVGLDPLAALQSVAVINGRPGLFADGLLAVCMGHPDFIDMDEKLKGKGDEYGAVCTVTRAGRDGKARKITREFLWKDAERANLTGGNVWKAYPQRMLAMRARSWALRDAFADALKGVRSAEEERDGVVDAVDVPFPREEEADRIAEAASGHEPPPEREEVESLEQEEKAPLSDETKSRVWETFQAWSKGKGARDLVELKRSLGVKNLSPDEFSDEQWRTLAAAVGA